MDIRKDILWRVYLCFIGMVILCVFVLGRAIYIQRVQGKFWNSMGDSLHIKIRTDTGGARQYLQRRRQHAQHIGTGI